MKIPQKPANWASIMGRTDPQRLLALFSRLPEFALTDRYLPWDEIRRRPAPDGLSHEEWWLGLKLVRNSKVRPLPLADPKAEPFVFCVPDSVQEQLHEIDRKLGFNLDLPKAATGPESRDHYVVNALIQESITSSQLEGAVTTREVAKELLRTNRPPRDRSERMIFNNYATMQRIRELRGTDLSPSVVLEIHAIVTRDALDNPDAAGRLRIAGEKVRVEDSEGTIFHEPPAADELPGRLQALCDFANGKSPGYFVHPVIRAIILHFWLAYDHPFVDGNGRTARALFYWSMLRQDCRLIEFISISQILLHSPGRYYEAFLHSETDDNDLTYFVIHQTNVLRQAVQALHDYIAAKTSELREASQRLRGMQGLNHRQQALLAHALGETHNRYLIEGHRRSHNVAFQTARDDLFDLEKRGFLNVRKEGRSNVFYAPATLAELLAEPPSQR